MLRVALVALAPTTYAQDLPVAPDVSDAASLEQTDALLRLGDYFSDGVSVPVDYGKARDFYQQAASAGRERGSLRIAEMLFAGEGSAPDVHAALALLETLTADEYPAAMVVLGRHYVEGLAGTLPADPQMGLALYRRAAGRGDTNALVALGDALVAGIGGKADPAEALAAYGHAAELGRTDAYLRIGDFHSQGVLAPVDLVRAYAAYKRGSEAGSNSATLRMAEMLARGHGISQDSERGLALVRELAETGNGSASMLLGQLLISGDVGAVDAAGAVAAFEAAAGTGRSEALLRLGEIFLDGVVVRLDRARALDYFERAVAGGNPFALYRLGRSFLEGRLGRAGTAAQGLALLEEARAVGVAEAVVGIADAHLYGYGVPQNPAAALDLLDAEAQSGNLAAGKRLLALFRDGSHDGNVTLVPRRPELARSYLDLIADRLDRSELLIETLLLEAAFAPSGDYDFLDERSGELAPGDQESLLRNLASVAPNAYVHLLQFQLARIGLYTGPRSGLLDQPTITSMLRFCDLKSVGDQCRRGPLTSRSAQILSYAF